MGITGVFMVDDFSGSGGGGGGSRSPTRTANNLLSQDYVEIIIGLGAGPWKGLVAGNHGPLQNFFLGDTPVQNVSDGTANFADFKIAQFSGGENDPPILRVLGGDSSNLNVGVTLASGISVTRVTSPALRKTNDFPGLDRLEVRIVFNQLVKSTDEGTFEHTAIFRIEYRATNSSTWLYYNNQSSISVKGKTDGAVQDYLIPVQPLTNADYEVRVTKISPDNGTQEIVNMGWESLQMVVLGKPEYPGLAKIHLYGRVSEQFSSLPEISGIYEGFLIWVPSNYNPDTRTYDESVPWNGQLVKRYSNNPAWVLYFLIKSTEYGLARYYQNVSVILQEFYNAGKWCDEQVPSAVSGQTQPRFTFNELIDSQKSGIDMLYYLAGSFNSVIYDSNNGVIRLKTDQMGTSKQLFTPETVVDGKFNYSFSDIATRYNDITVQYVNPDLNWELDERSASIDASEWIEANGRVPLSFVAIGCTNTHEAIRRANDRLLTANTEVTTVSFQTSRFGVLAELYDTILVADPISGWSTGGRIKSYASNVIQLRDPVFCTLVQAVTMKVQTYSGIVEIQVTPPHTGLCYSLNVTGGTFPSNVPDRVQFTVEGTNGFGFAKPFRVVGIAEVDGSIEQFQITAVEINPNKYTDSANGTVSAPIQYSYVAPQEPRLPNELVLKNTTPIVVTGGSLVYRIHATWRRPPNAFTDHYEIDFSEADSGVVKTQVAYGEETYLEPVKDNTYYSIRLFAVSPTGTRSRFAIENNAFLVNTKSTLLEDMSSDVGNFLLAQTATGWRAGWTPPVTPMKDFAGVMLRYTYDTPAPPWGICNVFGLSKPEENFKDLGWFEKGNILILAKFTNTSGNKSENPVYIQLNVLAPAAPTAVLTPVGGATQIILTNPTTTQPVGLIEVKLGEPDSDWETANLDFFTLSGASLTYNVVNRDGVETAMLVRATDVAGNVGEVSSFVIPRAGVEAGINTASASLYQWNTSTPASPNGTSTYTWATGVNSAYTGSDSWSLTVPNNPGIPLSKLWVVSKNLTASFGVPTSTVDYSGLPPTAQSTNGSNGGNGTPGIQGASPTVFRWSIGTPGGPIGSASYNWATGGFGAAPANWTLVAGNPPSPGYTLYAAYVPLLETAGIASTNFQWNNAIIDPRGAAGANGASAKDLSLSASSQIFKVDNFGTANPSSITFTATSQNLAGSPTFIATGGTLTGSGSTRTLTFANATSSPITVQVSQDGLIDVITVVKVFDGTDAYNVILSNEAHVLPADSTGGATSYAGAETYITILKGSNDDTGNWSITYSDSGLTSVRSTTSGGGATGNGRFWRVTNQTSDVGTIVFTLSKTNTPTLSIVFTCTLARKGPQGNTGTGTSGAAGNSYRTAYAVISGQSLSGSPANYITTGGANDFPPTGTWGGGETWGSAVPGYSAGQSIQQIDGIYNPNTGNTVWSSPYLSALKVGSLSVLTTNTGNLNVTGDMHMSGGAISAGAYTSSFNWPAAGGYGFHLSASGLLLGNYNNGNFFQVNQNGDMSMPGLSMSGGAASFSGALSAATGHFRGAISGGVYTSSWGWPAGTGTGFHLSSSGLLLGNPSTGRYFELDASGDVYAPGFSIINGSPTFSGTITGGVFQTATTGKRVVITGSSNSVVVYDSSNVLRGYMGEYDPSAGYASVYGYGNSSGVAGSFYANRPNGYALDVRNFASRASAITAMSSSLAILADNQGDGSGAILLAGQLTAPDHIAGLVLGQVGVGGTRLGVADASGAIGTILSTKNITVTTNTTAPTGGQDGDMVIVV